MMKERIANSGAATIQTRITIKWCLRMREYAPCYRETFKIYFKPKSCCATSLSVVAMYAGCPSFEKIRDLFYYMPSEDLSTSRYDIDTDLRCIKIGNGMCNPSTVDHSGSLLGIPRTISSGHSAYGKR